MSLTLHETWLKRHRPVTSVARTIAEATPLRSRFARDEPAADAGSSQCGPGERYFGWDFLDRDEHRE